MQIVPYCSINLNYEDMKFIFSLFCFLKTNIFNINLLFQVKVMHKQLLMFHNATLAYFSNNHQALETTLKQFNVKPKSPTASSVAASWLEK